MPLIDGEGIGTQAHSASNTTSLDHPAGSTPAQVHIRSYVESDRAAIRRLCCDTGFLGGPIDTVFQDRELFADLFTGAYLKHEPEWALVAEAEGRVVGYLLGSMCRHFDWVLMRSGLPVASKMFCKLLTGRYAGHPRSGRFVRWLLTAGYQEQPRHPAQAAHLHFDLERGYRGRGIIQRFWGMYEEKLRGAGVKRCYGIFFSHPQRHPESVYSRYGFTVFDRKRTTLFEPEISGVELVCVHKELGNGAGESA
jgi:hypothetical protein